MATAKKASANKVSANKVSAKKALAKRQTKGTTAVTRNKLTSTLPTPNELATSLGVSLAPALTPDQINRLRKALPGYAGLLDDVAELLATDAGAFDIPGVTPEALLTAQANQKFLVAREGIAQAVYRSIYEQRLQADDVAMKMLEKVARRVAALKEDDATLTTRYKLLLDFLSTFRAGGTKPATVTVAPAPVETVVSAK